MKLTRRSANLGLTASLVTPVFSRVARAAGETDQDRHGDPFATPPGEWPLFSAKRSLWIATSGVAVGEKSTAMSSWCFAQARHDRAEKRAAKPSPSRRRKPTAQTNSPIQPTTSATRGKNSTSREP